MGSDMVSGGCCLVRWSKVTSPSELAGLCVLDLMTLRYAVKLQWEWLARTGLKNAAELFEIHQNLINSDRSEYKMW
jgi:hypothetical protein